MGILSDTFEDNAERRGQILSPVRLLSDPVPPVKPRTPPAVWHPCPACGTPFSSQSALTEHLRRACGARHTYLRLNGQIVRDVAWAPEGVAFLEIVSLGAISPSLTLEIGGLTHRRAFSERLALDSHIPHGYSGEIRIRVSSSGRADAIFTVFAGREPRFSRSGIEESLQNLLEELDRTGFPPDISKWRRQVGVSSDDVLGERIVDGVFEYALAVHLENCENRTSKTHFEAAYGRLLPFDLPLTVGIRSALAVKMNFFEVLRERVDGSPFAAAYAIFTGEVPQSMGLCQKHVAHVITDQVTTAIVMACLHLKNEDPSAATRVLEQAVSASGRLSQNDADKVAFLNGLLNPSVAPDVFEELREHPTLGPRSQMLLNRFKSD